ncbi:MAG: addiction module antidote protein, HigA family [Anaerolinea sp.]|nr:addiction module antidote protein, HigA family [Anaerolinea sp.]
MATSVPIRPGIAVPPGETLAEELEARGLTQRALALRIGKSSRVVNAICRGERAINADTALALESALDGLSAEFWLRLQSDYDLTVARLRARTGKAVS